MRERKRERERRSTLRLLRGLGENVLGARHEAPLSRVSLQC